MLVAVKRERLHTHPGMLLKSPALWPVVKQFCEGRDSAAGLKTPFNNLDEDPPVWGGPGLKVTKLPFFRKKGYSSSSTRDEVFSPNFYKKWDIILVSFPFTDLKAAKKRPALMVSPDEYNQESDVIISFFV